jgi:hypothetical protein
LGSVGFMKNFLIFFFLQENPRPTTLGLRVGSKKDLGYNQNISCYTPTTQLTHTPYIVTMLLYIRYQYSAIYTVPHQSDHTCNVPARAFNGPRHPLLGSIPLPLSLLTPPFQHPGRTERYANTRHRSVDAKPSHKFETLLQSNHTVQGIKIANPGFSRQIIVKQLLSPPFHTHVLAPLYTHHIHVS